MVSLQHGQRPSWCSLCLRGKTVLYYGESVLARVTDAHIGEIEQRQKFPHEGFKTKACSNSTRISEA